MATEAMPNIANVMICTDTQVCTGPPVYSYVKDWKYVCIKPQDSIPTVDSLNPLQILGTNFAYGDNQYRAIVFTFPSAFASTIYVDINNAGSIEYFDLYSYQDLATSGFNKPIFAAITPLTVGLNAYTPTSLPSPPNSDMYILVIKLNYMSTSPIPDPFDITLHT